MTTRLFLFQIGPVQTFIAQARRTQDLFIGSHILSELASAGVLAASHGTNFEPIFPLVENGRVLGGAPHRFAFLCADTPTDVAAKVKTAIDERWHDGFASPVYRLMERAVGNGDWQTVFKRQRQALDWLEFYWVTVDYNANQHNVSFRNASVAMAQRRYARVFPSMAAEGEGGLKCTLTGSQSALFQGNRQDNETQWGKLRRYLRESETEPKIMRRNENLGTLALIKRLAVHALQDERTPIPDFENFPSTRHIAKDDPNAKDEASGNKDVEGYLAVLHMDGDQMGAKLGGLARLDKHQAFSRDLATYASKTAESIVAGLGGQTGRLVYSGGDDVLALLPLKHVLKCADELRKHFETLTGCTASAGIAITPENLPLDRALELARQAEETAKEHYGRNAVVVVEAHGSGQMRAAGAKWDVIDFMLHLQAAFEANILSGKLGFDLQEVDHYLFGDHLRGARELEVKRLMKRRTAENAYDEQKQEVKALAIKMIGLVEDHKSVPSWADMANWVILARFLAQGGRREEANAS